MKLKPYSEVFFVHYQCGDLNHDEVPITSLGIYAKDEQKTFDKSDESQNIKDYCNKVMQLCDEGLIPVHWNQNRDSYGITHILSRYKKLTGGTIQIEYRDCIDLSDFLWNKYGNDYIEHPRLDKLAELNSFRGHRKNEYGNRTFPENRLSLLTKIYAGELRGTLKTRINTPPVPTNEKQEQQTGQTKDPQMLTFINAQFGDVLREMLDRNGITFKKDKAFELVCLLYAIQHEVNGTFDFLTCQKLALFFGARIDKSEFSRKNPYSSSKVKPTKNLFSQRVDFMVKQLKTTAKEKSITYEAPFIQ